MIRESTSKMDSLTGEQVGVVGQGFGSLPHGLSMWLAWTCEEAMWRTTAHSMGVSG